MKYIDYDYYDSIYGEAAIEEKKFEKHLFEVCRKLDNETTGADGVRKLKVAFPKNEEDAEIVKRCICKMIEIAEAIETAKKQITMSCGYVHREDGTVVNKKISSITSGSESISYYTGNGSLGIIEKAAMDHMEENKLYRNIITEYLSGVTDANGVKLLYMGRYPY